MESKTDNELIAEFDDKMVWYVPSNKKYDAYWKRDGMQIKLEKMKYSISWDWLMPVVEKIRVVGETSIIPNIAGRVLKDIAEFSIITDKESIYKAVVKFIKWYNEQTKQA